MVNRIVQEQKMEALETMASAITHDFNNILTTITYSIELAIGDIPKDSVAYSDLKRALNTGLEAVDHFGEMFSFCKPTKNGFAKLDIAEVFQKTIPSLEKDLPDNIHIKQDVRSTKNTGEADPEQLKEIITQLFNNSVFALEKTGGKIEIVIDNDSFRPGENKCGTNCIKLSVSDNGPGIPHEIQHKLFDPFFTTKPKGIGKGLGLSIVYGFVKNHNGYIDFNSKPYEKTVFEIFLPIINGK